MNRHAILLDRALTQMGNTHSLRDILQALEDGSMQSFAVGDTWVVTQVLDLPQKRVMDVVLVVGDGADLEELSATTHAFAAFQDCSLMRAYGRHGWMHYAKQLGWRDTARVFLKEV